MRTRVRGRVATAEPAACQASEAGTASSKGGTRWDESVASLETQFGEGGHGLSAEAWRPRLLGGVLAQERRRRTTPVSVRPRFATHLLFAASRTSAHLRPAPPPPPTPP